MLHNVVACILAGGEGKRLWPLTAHRAKPAVRFGGSYRLIDFPLSNCINSAIRKILVFPQYKALSLERHLRRGWAFLSETLDEYILSIPPQQRIGQVWYRGTADAVYHNLGTLERIAPDYVLILAGDHVYRMDYRYLLQWHQDAHADVTVATFPIPRRQACRFGIVSVDPCGAITAFQEKPTDLSSLTSGTPLLPASMGIYLFTFKVLREVLGEDAQRGSSHDFGREILPELLGRYRMVACPFVEAIDGEPAYWRDVGTIDVYWQAHMDLVAPQPPFRLHQPQWPLHTAQAGEPPAIVLTPSDPSGVASGWVTNSLIAPGCVLQGRSIERSILAPGVHIEARAEVAESILFDGVRIGQGARVHRAIIDRGIVVPAGARIGDAPVADEAHVTVSAGGITVVGYPPSNFKGNAENLSQHREDHVAADRPARISRPWGNQG
jgi:glucose-1-phosphate adenylyltransferase